MATSFPHGMSSYGHRDLADHTQNDPLNLTEYTMPDTRDHRIDTLLRSSQSPSMVTGNSPSVISPFPDFSVNYSTASRDYQAFNTTYDRTQLASPNMKSAQYGSHHRGSISNLSDGHNSATVPHHRLSISSAGDFKQHMGGGSMDGIDSNTSPDSAHLGPGESMLGDGSLSLNTEDIGNGDGGDGPRSAKTDDKTDAPPPWSEMKTKAGKERKRLPLACIACRRKKIRCSGEKPACKHCLRSRIPCVYKVTTRKAAPRTDYMAMLDKRLKRMEDRVIKLIPKENLGSVATVGRAVVKPALPGPPSKTAGGKKRQAEEAFGADLDEWAKTKLANPNDGKPSSGLKGQDSDESELLTEGADALPSKEIQQHLAEIYFDFVYGQSYPLLHKPSFMRKLDIGLVPPVLILAVCAISARFSTHPQLRSEPAFLRGESWASVAREIALKRFDTPNITILIVYLLLGLHEFGTCQGGRSWMFGGMAQRMAYALQLHKDLDYDPSQRDNGERKKLSFLDREIQRRTMWSCFLMDRFNSSGTDRPLFVNEQFIRAQLPIKEKYFQMEVSGPTEDLEGGVPNPVSPDSGEMSDPKANMGVVAYLIRLVTIWGRLIGYMNLGGKEKEVHPMWSPQSTYHELKTQIQEFSSSLPECLRYNQENLLNHATERTANHFLYLHIVYYQIILFMNRFALPSTAGGRPSKDMPHEFLAEAARSALEAANQISILINEAMDYNVVAAFTGYCAFFSSTVHVHGVFSKNPKHEAQSKKYLAYNVKYLSKIKKYWGMFHFVAENLKELYRQHADAVLRGSSGSKGAQANIFQYGDWFDRYPHGVSKTDYEDPAAEVKKEPGTDAVLGQKSDLQSVEEFFASLSPPSRAEHQRKMAKKGKQRKSMSETQRPKVSTAQAGGTQQHQQHQQHQQQAQHQQLAHMSIPHEAMDTTFDPTYFTTTSQQAGFAPSADFQPDLLLQSQPGMLPSHGSIDLSAFAGMDPAVGSAPMAQSTNSLWGLELAGLGNNYFADPSSAWFMPFNVDPPNIGGDDALFGGMSYNFGFDGSAAAVEGGLQGLDAASLGSGGPQMDGSGDASGLMEQ